MERIKGKTMKYEKGALLRGITDEYTQNVILIVGTGVYNGTLSNPSGEGAPIYHFLILDRDMKQDWHYATYLESDRTFAEIAT